MEKEEDRKREKERDGVDEREWGTPVARTCVRFSAVNEMRLGEKEHEGCGNVLLKGHARPRICRNHSGIVSTAI